MFTSTYLVILQILVMVYKIIVKGCKVAFTISRIPGDFVLSVLDNSNVMPTDGRAIVIRALVYLFAGLIASAMVVIIFTRLACRY